MGFSKRRKNRKKLVQVEKLFEHKKAIKNVQRAREKMARLKQHFFVCVCELIANVV